MELTLKELLALRSELPITVKCAKNQTDVCSTAVKEWFTVNVVHDVEFVRVQIQGGRTGPSTTIKYYENESTGKGSTCSGNSGVGKDFADQLTDQPGANIRGVGRDYVNELASREKEGQSTVNECLIPVNTTRKLKFVNSRKRVYTSVAEVIEDKPRYVKVEVDVYYQTESRRGREDTIIRKGTILELKWIHKAKFGDRVLRFLKCTSGSKVFSLAEETPVTMTPVPDLKEYRLSEINRFALLPTVIQFIDQSDPYIDMNRPSTSPMLMSYPLRMLQFEVRDVRVAVVNEEDKNCLRIGILPNRFCENVRLVPADSADKDYANVSISSNVVDSEIREAFYGFETDTRRIVWFDKDMNELEPESAHFCTRFGNGSRDEDCECKKASEFDTRLQDRHSYPSTNSLDVTDAGKQHGQEGEYEEMMIEASGPRISKDHALASSGTDDVSETHVLDDDSGYENISQDVQNVDGHTNNEDTPGTIIKGNGHKIDENNQACTSETVINTNNDSNYEDISQNVQNVNEDSNNKDTSKADIKSNDNVTNCSDSSSEITINTNGDINYTNVSDGCGPDHTDTDASIYDEICIENKDTTGSIYLSMSDDNGSEMCDVHTESAGRENSFVKDKSVNEYDEKKAFFTYSITEVQECLTLCSLGDFGNTCREQTLDGKFFENIELSIFKSAPFNLNDFQILKLDTIINKGWRPKR